MQFKVILATLASAALALPVPAPYDARLLDARSLSEADAALVARAEQGAQNKACWPYCGGGGYGYGGAGYGYNSGGSGLGLNVAGLVGLGLGSYYNNGYGYGYGGGGGYGYGW